MAVRRTSHARYALWDPFAWGTKYRKKIWTDRGQRESVKRLFRTIASAYDMAMGTIELLADHVHFTLTVPPRIAPARADQILKSVRTKALFLWYPKLHRQYWGGELWVSGYFVRSTGPGLTKEQSDRYIKEQSEERYPRRDTPRCLASGSPCALT